MPRWSEDKESSSLAESQGKRILVEVMENCAVSRSGVVVFSAI